MRKIIIYVMVCLLQIGSGISITQASSLPTALAHIQQQSDQDQDRQEAERVENERHDRAMERRPNESEREWNERQQRENERHERKLWLIAHAILN